MMTRAFSHDPLSFLYSHIMANIEDIDLRLIVYTIDRDYCDRCGDVLKNIRLIIINEEKKKKRKGKKDNRNFEV